MAGHAAYPNSTCLVTWNKYKAVLYLNLVLAERFMPYYHE
jgi:hypothetical protein